MKRLLISRSCAAMRHCRPGIWLLLIGLTAVSRAQQIPAQSLYRSRLLTAAHSFTIGVEGPGVDRDGNLYAVNYNHEGTIGKISPQGKAEVFLELPKGSVANGIRFDHTGHMLIADYTGHSIWKLDMQTKSLALLAHEPGMSQPNDIALDNRGHIFASDPDWKAGTGKIWRIDADGTVSLLDSMKTVNGIEVSPDNRILYVNELLKIWAYDLSPGGEISGKRLVIEFTDFVLDGMRCDAAGNLYQTRFGKGMIAMISPNGKLLREIPLKGSKPTNVAFGGTDGRTLYVTMQDQGNIETFRVSIPGREWKMIQKINNN